MKTKSIFLFTALVMIFQGLVSSKPITQSPRTLSAGLGETVTLSCKTSSGVGDDLSWYHQKPGQPPKLLFYNINTRASGTPSRYTSSGSEPNYSLAISAVEAADAGEFYCLGYYGASVLTFGGGTQLIVYSGPVRAPTVSLLSSPQQRSGSRLTLLCLLGAYSPQGSEVSWEVDGRPLTDTDGAVWTSVEQEQSGLFSRSSVLSLSEDAWQEEQQFSCRVLHHGRSRLQSLQRSQC